ncbi:PolC-type DNA polymerase III [Paenibacillus sp. JCM 10914]|uniref:3'-5' exonuclease n=1 Tax=Paenibacillus sp. JCM 10914 TaxID=1236974 RepID=UPI00130E8302|nr:3'-5' exonuclease [Paenibacillus sp. JCM 10914]
MKIEIVSDTEYTISELLIDQMHSRRYCIFDVEATGPDEMEDQITQIGAILLDASSGKVEKTLETLVKPSKRIPAAIERLTGIYNQDVEQAPSFSEIFQDFVDFTEGTVLVTQAGYEFDWPLLQNECRRHEIMMLSNSILDTKVLFTYLYPEIKDVISTNLLIRHLEIDDSDIQRHTALGDSILIGRIFAKLLIELELRELVKIEIEQPLLVKRVQFEKIM